MQTKRIYQVQRWLNGQWSREHNWCKVEAFREKEAAEKVCGAALTEAGKLAQLRARVLTLGNLRQRSATPFYDRPTAPALLQPSILTAASRHVCASSTDGFGVSLSSKSHTDEAADEI